jgi:hypothetical protein
MPLSAFTGEYHAYNTMTERNSIMNGFNYGDGKGRERQGGVNAKAASRFDNVCFIRSSASR